MVKKLSHNSIWNSGSFGPFRQDLCQQDMLFSFQYLFVLPSVLVSSAMPPLSSASVQIPVHPTSSKHQPEAIMIVNISLKTHNKFVQKYTCNLYQEC